MNEKSAIMLYVVIGLFVVIATYTLFRLKTMYGFIYTYIVGTDRESKVAMGKLVIQCVKVMLAVVCLCGLYEIGVRLYGGETELLKLLK